MQINITGHGTEVSQPLKDYVNEKTAKFEEFFGNIQKTEVVLDARDNANADQRQVAEIRVWVAGHKMIMATEAGRDMYAAIDLAVDDVKRQLEKHKEMMVKEHRRQGTKLKQISREIPASE
ncbi:MAG: ribosome-associated translation inhibitor RaiA [Candidatus Margulisbacteria bacterium]|nr:ribosome-associated translation inhibitor RaiA [Candidatus Margulisiibacteriota bacterium]MBU1616179.1 ribosome-associated translation inhibitor RaiA [Candidatus Margulisiibacteriota bacterium]MBU1867589.1 ribosome-associated translation inhibitor RaiA [Candidatus Margulisiibacteriota bacterium]